MKARFDLLPADSLREIAEVLTHGAEKYGDNNWSRAPRWSVYYAALLRHLFDWKSGEDYDPDTGCSHLAHAACCLLFLMEFQGNDWSKDDRVYQPDRSTFYKDDGIGTSSEARPDEPPTYEQLTIPGLDVSFSDDALKRAEEARLEWQRKFNEALDRYSEGGPQHSLDPASSLKSDVDDVIIINATESSLVNPFALNALIVEELWSSLNENQKTQTQPDASAPEVPEDGR